MRVWPGVIFTALFIGCTSSEGASGPDSPEDVEVVAEDRVISPDSAHLLYGIAPDLRVDGPLTCAENGKYRWIRLPGKYSEQR